MFLRSVEPATELVAALKYGKDLMPFDATLTAPLTWRPGDAARLADKAVYLTGEARLAGVTSSRVIESASVWCFPFHAPAPDQQ